MCISNVTPRVTGHVIILPILELKLIHVSTANIGRRHVGTSYRNRYVSLYRVYRVS